MPGLKRGAAARSGAVCPLRGARRRRGQVRLREPADAGLGDDPAGRRRQHFGTVFRIAGSRKDASIALLWAKEDGYWKIVSWQAEPEPDRTPAPPAPPEPAVVRIKADLTLVHAAKSFVDSLVDPQGLRRGVSIPVDEKLRVLRPHAQDPTRRRRHRSTTPAGRSAPVSNASANGWASRARLEAIIEAVEPRHASIRVMDQPYSRVVQPHQPSHRTRRRRRV